MNIHAIEEIQDAAQERPPVLAVRFGRGRTGGDDLPGLSDPAGSPGGAGGGNCRWRYS